MTTGSECSRSGCYYFKNDTVAVKMPGPWWFYYLRCNWSKDRIHIGLSARANVGNSLWWIRENNLTQTRLADPWMHHQPFPAPRRLRGLQIPPTSQTPPPQAAVNLPDLLCPPAEFLFLLWGVYLCYAVRTVPSAFHEPRYMAAAIYNELLISAIFHIIR